MKKNKLMVITNLGVILCFCVSCAGTSKSVLIEDINDDGRVNKKEWKEWKKEQFESYDSNKDGSLSIEETEKLMKGSTPSFTDDLNKTYKKFDENNDGKINRVEWFRRDTIFNEIDRNHDGMLTDEERQKVGVSIRLI
ncbi:EF-hand domain-containing protein [Chlamydiota bacterium]